MENNIEIKKRHCPLCKESKYSNELFYNSEPWKLVQCQCSFVYMPEVPEGVLAACALDAFGCHFQGRFIFDNENDIKVANSMGIKDLTKKYELKEIVKGDSLFCATGITNSDILKGISINNNTYASETLITHKSSNYKKVVRLVKSLDE